MIIKKRRCLGVFCMALSLAVLTSAVSGCANFRKKFVRQKKQDEKKPEFEPILDPIDYPPTLVSSEERYTHYHRMWKIWHRDLMENIDVKSSDKRIHYLIDQLILQLDEMDNYVADNKKKELEELIGKLKNIYAEFRKPAGFRNIQSLKIQLNNIDRRIREEYSPDKMKEFFL